MRSRTTVVEPRLQSSLSWSCCLAVLLTVLLQHSMTVSLVQGLVVSLILPKSAGMRKIIGPYFAQHSHRSRFGVRNTAKKRVATTARYTSLRNQGP
ncbi:hypothetical protein GGR50DRAFT_485380 [Xylaria sp. CBS 124048]|nr:hypothetical protein GGR50DRAFT_485380 [Xylaria sp. CBS 124048]